jgi:hypothetical protein
MNHAIHQPEQIGSEQALVFCGWVRWGRNLRVSLGTITSLIALMIRNSSSMVCVVLHWIRIILIEYMENWLPRKVLPFIKDLSYVCPKTTCSWFGGTLANIGYKHLTKFLPLILNPSLEEIPM